MKWFSVIKQFNSWNLPFLALANWKLLYTLSWSLIVFAFLHNLKSLSYLPTCIACLSTAFTRYLIAQSTCSARGVWCLRCVVCNSCSGGIPFAQSPRSYIMMNCTKVMSGSFHPCGRMCKPLLLQRSIVRHLLGSISAPTRNIFCNSLWFSFLSELLFILILSKLDSCITVFYLFQNLTCVMHASSYISFI